MAYLRIATHSRIFDAPLTPQTALENVERLLTLPQAHVLAEGRRFWECYGQIAGEVPVRGNLVPDAHVAALLLEHGVPLLYTSDRDFRKFGSVTTQDPFS